MPLDITYDENLITEIATKFDLREPNAVGLCSVVQRLEKGNFHPQEQLTLDLATGAGKTYIMAALIEYLRRQGHPNVMVVTPNKVVQDKTIGDFSEGSHRYVGGFDAPPRLITPDDVSHLRMLLDTQQVFASTNASTVYVFNVQQLFPPKEDGKSVATGIEAQRRKTYRFQEQSGVLAERLIEMDDLVIIVDEAHLFGSTAKTFRSSLTTLEPAATIGLTASSSDEDDVIYRYPLWRAISDGFVKQPVLVYRESGYDSDERQLQDAVSLLKIKEEAYSNWRNAHPEGKQTKPLLFVVCSDVNHATETSETIRNTYFPVSEKSAPQVLQVDNQHDDATTQNFLRYLDTDNSPIRVIVSVNKLREGWDTKRIAVMCTLRAMGSEVLTQQVMGRGLRLPFGELTGEAALDELDILSHKSFVKLLKSENVLKEFGIEEEVPNRGGRPRIAPPGTKSDARFGEGAGTEARTDTSTSGADSTDTNGDTGTDNQARTEENSFLLGSRGVGDNEDIADNADTYEPVIVSVNEEFAHQTFLFPSSAMSRTQRPFELEDIPINAVIEQAKKVTDTDEYLERVRIEKEQSGSSLKTQRLDRVGVDSFRQTLEDVKRELIKRVMRTGAVQVTDENDAQLRRSIVPTFIEESGIEQWTEKAMGSAASLLVDLVVAQAKENAAKNTFVDIKIQPTKLPIQTAFALPNGVQITTPMDTTKTDTKQSSGFIQGAYYGPWSKGLFNASAFDSFSAEYQLAQLLNFDNDVTWWTRIYPRDGAKIAYSTQHNYIPDFVVLDTEGTYWLIEGKSEGLRGDPIVQAKREATEKLLRKLVSHPKYKNQRWGYMLAFEADIRYANSLADLRGHTQPEVMPKV